MTWMPTLLTFGEEDRDVMYREGLRESVDSSAAWASRDAPEGWGLAAVTRPQ